MAQEADRAFSGRVTHLLERLRSGSEPERAELFEIVYADLRRMARARMARVPASDTLQPTALVHEAALRLLGREAEANDRNHFLALAARAMRDIIVEQARRHGAAKRGGDFQRLTLSGEWLAREGDEPLDALVVDEALTALAHVDSVAARLVELRVFAGLGVAEVAAELGLSLSGVDRRWAFARAWLARRLAAVED